MNAVVDAIRVESIEPIGRDEAGRLAAAEHGRYLELLRSLAEADWTKPTDCELWDVRDMAGHSVGMMGDFSSYRSLFGRMSASGKAAKRSGGPMVDAMTAQQVAATADLSNEELVARCAEVGPKSARWRVSRNRLFRRMSVKDESGGVVEKWPMAFLLDVILTRDPWMHRIDIARAIGREPTHTPEHDGRIVADVVAEWARRHGQPCHLTLTGPAGGTFVAGEGGEELTLDVVDFCRILSGRAEGTGLLATSVPF